MSEKNNSTEVTVRLVDGRIKYGYIVTESKSEHLGFITTSKYRDYLTSKSKQLIEYLPAFLVASIMSH